MKKIIILSLFLLLCIHNASPISIISGTWNRKGKSIYLFEIENGALKEIASAAVGDNKKFTFAVDNQKAQFYVIGTSDRVPLNNLSFYLKSDDKLNVAVNDTSYVLLAGNSPENIAMENWQNIIQPLQYKAFNMMKINSTYVDFFPMLDDKLEAIENFKAGEAVNANFAKSFELYRKFDLQNILLTFLFTPRSAHPQAEDMPEIYDNINLANITATADILNYPYGINLLKMVRTFGITKYLKEQPEEEKKKMASALERLKKDMPEVNNELVKGEVVLSEAVGIRNYEVLDEINNAFKNCLTTDSQKQRMQALLADKVQIATGQKAFDFKFKDVNNKDIALSDFKGKVVYIDVWATWCGPCKKEIPHLKKLEEEYAKQNIVFLGVSVDETKDIDKWKAFLIKEKLAGVQVFAGDQKEDINKPYKITGIPRFILIGKDGNIVTSDAPRPSSADIRGLLNNSLAK